MDKAPFHPKPGVLEPGVTPTPYEEMALRLANFLMGQQVIAEDSLVSLSRSRTGKLEGTIDLRLLKKRPDAVSLHLVVDLQQSITVPQIWCSTNRSRIGPLGVGDFFRVDLEGRLSALPGFTGVQAASLRDNQTREAQSRNRSFSVAERIKATLRALPGLKKCVDWVRNYIPKRADDLSFAAGVTWQVQQLDLPNFALALHAYDRGGFYDENINAEGLVYADQVPGNYYADAYGAYLLGWFFSRTEKKDYLNSCCAALEFLLRTYPQYLPASIVWHHSDFKNAALLETLALIHGQGGCDQSSIVKACEQLVSGLIEDWYDPTNVHALRFHWRSARLSVSPSLTLTAEDEKHITQSLVRLRADQTQEGLFHDNIASYPDAHDLTYHQYSLACLAQGLSWKDHPEARELFLRGVAFSLALTTPDGEVAYVGRAANNIHHSASAILSFLTAASFPETPTHTAMQYRRAARLVFERLRSFQEANGFLPTAMNHLSEERVGWNHCETPYNALVGAFLAKSSAFSASDEEAPIPLEQPGYVAVFNDSGFAAVRTENFYAVLFGGCSKSYAWSEGRHVTGIAGLAQVGLPDRGPLLPILDHPPGNKQTAEITDLPIINGNAPYGRGQLTRLASDVGCVLYSHEYGGAELARVYLFLSEQVVVFTKITMLQKQVKNQVRGVIAIPVRNDPSWTTQFTKEGGLSSMGKEGAFRVDILAVHPGVCVRSRRGRMVTNPRGKAARMELAEISRFHPTEPLWACHLITVSPESPHQEKPIGKCQVTANLINLEINDQRFSLDLGKPVEGKFN